MLGHCDIVKWNVGDRVYFDREPTTTGTVTSVDDPPFTVEVVWDGDESTHVVWSNRLVRV